MIKLSKKFLILGISASLCTAALAGCGVKNDIDTDTSSVAEEADKEEEEFSFSLPDSAEESEIYVEPIPDISDEFIRGMDASAVLAVENSGAKYYNFDGEEQDVFMTLAQAGVNYIRLRVWNDPYDENGNGYGGGNNDVETAIELGKRATKYGMKVNIDFHYSDFWADPKRQHAPKAWEGMTVDEKAEALSTFTRDSLNKMLDAGVDIGMVQIGNEINFGMSDETDTDAVMKLLCAGSGAVREVADTYQQKIQIVVHYTNINDLYGLENIAENLSKAGVDYDVFGLSYYPFWAGDNDDMQAAAQMIMDKYDKKVVIAETSYCYTSEDGDGYDNSLVGVDDLVDGYGATVQSQASIIRDICAAANEVGVEGVFYWEGTWIPVGEPDADNSALWEKYGSGWASSYASDYDPEDAGLYYGGCSWDNQAMFDFDGHPLESLNVFKYLKYGTIADVKVDFVKNTEVTCTVGGSLQMPETVTAVNNDRSEGECAVTWDKDKVDAVDTGSSGEYEVTGTADNGQAVKCVVKVSGKNYLKNSSFEDSDTSMWNISYKGSNPTDFQKKEDDAHSGEMAFHFWSGDSDMDFSIEQKVTGLKAGTYQLSVFSQGGDMEDDADLELYAIVDGKEQTSSFALTGYADWKNPTISGIKVKKNSTVTIGVRMKCNVNSWGTVDDFSLTKKAV